VEAAEESANPYAAGGAAVSAAGVLSLALWAVILFGLAKGHAWSWWLLTFSTLVALLVSVIGVIAGTGLGVGIVMFVVNILMMAALFHKETITTFRPNLSIIKGGWTA